MIMCLEWGYMSTMIMCLEWGYMSTMIMCLEWGYMSTCALLIHLAITKQIQQSVLVYYKVIIISSNVTCFHHDVAEKLLICH
jgi:hypothetical protein